MSPTKDMCATLRKRIRNTRSRATRPITSPCTRAARFDVSASGSTFFTIGHSNRSVDELVALLRAANVTLLVDVRTIRRSRSNLQFNLEYCRKPCRRTASTMRTSPSSAACAAGNGKCPRRRMRSGRIKAFTTMPTTPRASRFGVARSPAGAGARSGVRRHVCGER
jgi:hypothetical protein